MTFSIIIPIYNMEQHLERCLNSIVNQTYSDLEIILINDGSTDMSASICDTIAKKDQRIIVIHQPNSGVSSARNRGLEQASGDYISFIDPDDWVEATMYETLAFHFNNKEIDILRFNAYRKGEILNPLPFEGEYSGEKLEEEIMLPLIGAKEFGGMFILGVLWLHVYKRRLIDQYAIRFNKQLRRCEDRLFTLTSALHAKNILFINDVLYHYEVYDESLSNKYDLLRWQQELTYLEELQKEYTACKEQYFIDEANERIRSEYLLRAVTSINNEFFSNNTNSFSKRYRNIKAIINHPKTRDAVKLTPRNKMGLKGKLTLGMIEYKLSLLLSLFNTAIVFKNKI